MILGETDDKNPYLKILQKTLYLKGEICILCGLKLNKVLEMKRATITVGRFAYVELA